MYVIVSLIDLAFNIYVGIILLQVVLSWLIAFEVINAGNTQAQNLIRLLKKATDPLYKPLRKYIPPIGGIDLTPLVVLIGLSFLRSFLIGILI